MHSNLYQFAANGFLSFISIALGFDVLSIFDQLGCLLLVENTKKRLVMWQTHHNAMNRFDRRNEHTSAFTRITIYTKDLCLNVNCGITVAFFWWLISACRRRRGNRIASTMPPPIIANVAKCRCTVVRICLVVLCLFIQFACPYVSAYGMLLVFFECSALIERTFRTNIWTAYAATGRRRPCILPRFTAAVCAHHMRSQFGVLMFV